MFINLNTDGEKLLVVLNIGVVGLMDIINRYKKLKTTALFYYKKTTC